MNLEVIMSVKIINGKDILNLIANEHPYAHVHVDALDHY